MIGRRLVLALVCCGVGFATAARSQTNHVINVIDPMNFNPPEVTIAVGDTVTFQKGNTNLQHNVRSDGFTNGCAQSATCFRSGNLTNSGFTFNLDVFSQPGTFRFFCELHGSSGGFGMAGRIIVEGGAPPPTPTATPPPPPPPTADAGAIRFTNPSYSRAENVGNAAIQVERVSGSDGAVSVSFSTTNGSATAGQDYTTAMGTLNWADGEAGTKTFDVAVDQRRQRRVQRDRQSAPQRPHRGCRSRQSVQRDHDHRRRRRRGAHRVPSGSPARRSTSSKPPRKPP